MIHAPAAHDLLAPSDLGHHLAEHHPDITEADVAHLSGLTLLTVMLAAWGIDVTDEDPVTCARMYLHEADHRRDEAKTLSFDEAEALGFDGTGRDDNGPYAVADLTPVQRATLAAYRATEA